MEYRKFERDFILRSMALLDQYDEHVPPSAERYETTLLLNCLLGLLVVPHECLSGSIPPLPIHALHSWGIPVDAICWGRMRGDRLEKDTTLCDLVCRMRNGVAHVRILPLAERGEIDRIEFSDRNGFRVTLPAAGLRLFVTNLARVLTEK